MSMNVPRRAALACAGCLLLACGGQGDRGRQTDPRQEAVEPAVAAAPPRPAKTGRKEGNDMEWKGQQSPIAEPSTRVIRTQREWTSLWDELGQSPPRPELGPHIAVAVFLGMRNTGGFGVRFLEPSQDASALTIRYETVAPKETDFVIQVITHPYAVRLFPATGLPVKLVPTAP